MRRIPRNRAVRDLAMVTLCDSLSDLINILIIDISPFKYGPQSERVNQGDMNSVMRTPMIYIAKTPWMPGHTELPVHLQAFLTHLFLFI